MNNQQTTKAASQMLMPFSVSMLVRCWWNWPSIYSCASWRGTQFTPMGLRRRNSSETALWCSSAWGVVKNLYLRLLTGWAKFLMSSRSFSSSYHTLYPHRARPFCRAFMHHTCMPLMIKGRLPTFNHRNLACGASLPFYTTRCIGVTVQQNLRL